MKKVWAQNVKFAAQFDTKRAQFNVTFLLKIRYSGGGACITPASSGVSVEGFRLCNLLYYSL